MCGCNLGEDQVGVQGHSSLYIRFQARLCYTRPCIKRGGEQNPDITHCLQLSFNYKPYLRSVHTPFNY